MRKVRDRDGWMPGVTRATRWSTAALLAIVVVATFAQAGPRRRFAALPVRQTADIPGIVAQTGHATSCEGCHSMHGEGGTPEPGLLLAPNDNLLCAGCHDGTPWTTLSFPGLAHFTGSPHGSSPNAVWPGPTPAARSATDAGKCLNCHDPHGFSDANGVIPRLGLVREENLCLSCHDGAPATDNVLSDLLKPYRHPVTDYTGRHAGPGESTPEAFARTPANLRHAECEDCHNPHVSRADGPFGATGNTASLTTLGVSRVKVTNGAAGTVPLYTLLPASDTTTTPIAEYPLCLKCHSSWTTAPVGQTDFGKVLNPANPSYHPVEAAGRDTRAAAASFVTGWSATSTTRCGDCHGSDFGLAKGPHGSIYPHLLKKPYEDLPGRRATSSNDLCFSCHEYNVYANGASNSTVQSASRFNSPSVSHGHVFHVVSEQVPCADCHVTHGSTTLPSLLVTGRNPGLNSYTRTTNGGTCSPTCHGSESYTVNYAR